MYGSPGLKRIACSSTASVSPRPVWLIPGGPGRLKKSSCAKQGRPKRPKTANSRRSRVPRVTIMWRPSPLWSLVNIGHMIRVGRKALVDGRRIIRSHPSRASAATEKVRLRRHRRVTRSPGHDPFVTPPDDRCGSRRHPQFVLASDRADDGRQEDRRFEGTPQEKTGTGSSLLSTPKNIQAGWSIGPGIR